jgi:hypothetical protein
MSDDNWQFSADGTKTGWVRNKATMAKLKFGTLFRFAGLLAVIFTAYNLFAPFLGGVPVLEFWPELLMTVAPESMSSIMAQGIAAVVGAIVVWFF